MQKLKVLTNSNVATVLSPLRRMATSGKTTLKLDSLNNEMFKALREKTLSLRKEKLHVHLSGNNLNVTPIEKSCPLTFFMLKHKYKIDTQSIQIKVASRGSGGEGNIVSGGDASLTGSEPPHGDSNHGEGATPKVGETSADVNCAVSGVSGGVGASGGANFLNSFIQFNIPVLNEFDRAYFYKHIIEIIDTLAADVVYRHSIGGYKKNDKHNFVTVLFNNLKVYEKSQLHHEFCFSLYEQKPLTINCYLVHSGNTSYILKLDFFQEDKLIFDIYTTFVNINSLTFKPQEVVPVVNSHQNEKYEQVSLFAAHLKDVQNLFNHKDVKNKFLRQEDVNFMLDYFKNTPVEKKTHEQNEYRTTDIFEYAHVQAKSAASGAVAASGVGAGVGAGANAASAAAGDGANALPILGHILDTNDVAFYTGKNNFYCKDSYVESKNFISSEFKNIHNVTFGGYLAYLSFCHAMTIIKHYVARPVLIELNEIQYILPVPCNSIVSFRGKVVYCDADKIQIKIAAYCFDLKKNAYYLTTIFDMSFENNSAISFIPQSEEEVKLYLLSYIRSQLLP
ncbi:thioesterase/thiol ester dehydrase-isomerase, putative [Plasmodium vivax]|nr:thioesterase/thiol ester dehydrase-isomerase, putative [Plasmodium vivax]